jgi:predicted DNA-binding transcriptional regulator YafY
MNRLDRLAAILVQLQSRKVLKAQDIALRYDISLRTVYRDMRSLEEAGVPIIGEAGFGYSLAAGYRLPPVMFSREEATAFLTAEKLVCRFTDATNSASYQSAMDKIRAVLRSTEQSYLEHIDSRIEVLECRRPTPRLNDNLMQTILKSIAEKLLLEIEYFAYYRQEQTRRQVEPIGVFYLDNYWHLIAYCRSRKAIRDFRFDRISDIKLLGGHYEDVHGPFIDYVRNLYKDVALKAVRIRVDQAAYLHLGEQKYYQSFIAEDMTSDGVIIDFMTISVEGFARWFMSIADCAQIIEPAILADRVQTLLAAALKKNESFSKLLT